MAISSNTSANISLPKFNQNPTKLESSNNYLRWQTQVHPALRSSKLMGIVDGTNPCPPKFINDDEGMEIPNPKFSVWTHKDHYVLSWLTTTLSDSVLFIVFGLDTSRQVWAALSNRFASQSHSRITHLKKNLQNLKQGSTSCSRYLQIAKSLVDQLAAIGQTVKDDDLISLVMNGLNPSFTNFITLYSIATKEKQLNFDDFHDELVNREMLLN